MDKFLTHHGIDVGRSYGLLLLVSAVTSFYEVLGRSLVGHVHIDLTLVLSTVLGLALWRHRPWSRIVLIVLAWVVVAAFALTLVVVPLTGSANLRLTFGSTVITAPAVWQVYVFGAAVSPVCWFVLATLHSAKARAEFAKPHQLRVATRRGQ